MNFLKVFFGTTFILVISFYGFIVAVDPYNKLGINVFGFETKAVDFPRVNKFNQIQHSKKMYEAFILGSSSAHRYPTSVVKEMTGLETYNYAVQSACFDDYVAMINHIKTRMKPKLIIISMDFFCLNKFFKTDDMFYSSPLKGYLGKNKVIEEENNRLFNKAYFTLSALTDSFKVVWVNMFGEARHAYVEDGNYFKEKDVEGKVKVGQFPYPPYEIEPVRVEQLLEIKKLSKEIGFKLVLFTSPISYEHLKRIENNPSLKEPYLQFKDILKEHADYYYDFWNEDIKNYNETRYFRDSTHPSREFSILAMKKVLETIPKSNP